ncbi:MAG: hypothetical protein A3F11_06420 [Gammaproteobacteria bacterium RIFCSPHIGHO2_12_FULL_37_14]|nr:MAG: hypothetical protein A3F11_06420 [Gammaproteobacteria bacterium RIFCSPHIGHO2_12_FULL_37_14]
MAIPSNTLVHILRQKIENQQGYISFAEFMEQALYHPQWGYYNSTHFNIGERGDFTTAPEISPLFAQCVANQCREIFDHLGQGQVLEIGAGTGKFAKDFLSYLDTLGCLPSAYYIFEKSSTLRNQQRAFLQSTCPHFFPRMIWLDTLPAKFSGVVIANEVLDALPVHCFRIEDHEIAERCVTWQNDAFAWKICKPTTDELSEKIKQIHHQYALPPGYESEINLNLTFFLQSLTQAIEKGILLLIDYGYGQREYYRTERSSGTLSCFYQHHNHANPFILPGQQDITAHVDFTRVIETAIDNDCQLLGYTNQGPFLLACGLTEFVTTAEKQLSPIEIVHLRHAIKLLTFPTEMGERIKIMALGKNMSVDLSGFNLQDKRKEL